MQIKSGDFSIRANDYPGPPQGPGGASAHLYSQDNPRKPVHSISADTIATAIALACDWATRHSATGQAPRVEEQPLAIAAPEEAEVVELQPILLPPARDVVN